MAKKTAAKKAVAPKKVQTSDKVLTASNVKRISRRANILYMPQASREDVVKALNKKVTEFIIDSLGFQEAEGRATLSTADGQAALKKRNKKLFAVRT